MDCIIINNIRDMDSIEYNNRERLREFGNAPASEMSIRARIAMETLVAIVGVERPCTDEVYNQCVERAIILTDKFIEKLCSNE